MNNVTITITNTMTGKCKIVPYNHLNGLQYYPQTSSTSMLRPVTYLVPKYKVEIKMGGIYESIRFALKNNGQRQQNRLCDTGLSNYRICKPTFLPNYSPHSFQGGSRPGAWQLLPGAGFLIHEGADSLRGQVGGSLGCIEILDGKWNSFLEDIERIGGGKCAKIGQNKKLTVIIEAAAYPTATLV